MSGWCKKVVGSGRHRDRASVIAQLVAEQAPLGVQATLVNARVARAVNERAAVDHLRRSLPAVLASDDAREGLRSFLERRKARFRGV